MTADVWDVFVWLYTAGRGLDAPTLAGIAACFALFLVFAVIVAILRWIDPDGPWY